MDFFNKSKIENLDNEVRNLKEELETSKKPTVVGLIDGSNGTTHYHSYEGMPMAKGMVESVASIISSLPLMVYKKTEDGYVKYDNPELDFALNVLANPGQSSSSVIRDLVTNNMEDGYSYIYAPNQYRSGFTALSKRNVTDSCTPSLDNDGFIQGTNYHITINNVSKTTEKVWKCNYRASGIRDNHRLINKLCNINDFENDIAEKKGRPYGNYVSEVPLSKEQIIDLQSMAKRNGGNLDDNVLYKINFVPISLNPKDIGLSEIKQGAIRELEICFGFPPNYYSDKYNMSYSEKIALLKNNTIMPLCNSIIDVLNISLLGITGMEEGLTIRFDFSQLNKGNFGELIDNIDKLYKDGMITKNEGRELVGLEKVECGNEFSLSLGSVLQDKDTGDLKVPNTGQNVNGDKPIDEDVPIDEDKPIEKEQDATE